MYLSKGAAADAALMKSGQVLQQCNVPITLHKRQHGPKGCSWEN